MALKDWKKISEQTIRIIWKNKLTDKRIFIIQYYGFKDWTFSDFDKSKNFKTKSEALAYAKSYMRKN